jgi:hypothetical protein
MLHMIAMKKRGGEETGSYLDHRRLRPHVRTDGGRKGVAVEKGSGVKNAPYGRDEETEWRRNGVVFGLPSPSTARANGRQARDDWTTCAASTR